MEKCKTCENTFIRRSSRHTYCEECSNKRHKERCKNYYKKTYVRKGYSQKGKANNNWRGGVSIYRNLVEIENCERCKSTSFLLVHHKNGNRNDNAENNLEVLCKKCHQITHKCWEVLPKGKDLSNLKKVQAQNAARDVLGKFTKEDL